MVEVTGASPDAVILRDMLRGRRADRARLRLQSEVAAPPDLSGRIELAGRAALRHRPRQAVRLHQEGHAELGRAAGAHGHRDVRQHGRRGQRAPRHRRLPRGAARSHGGGDGRRATAIRSTCWRAGRIDGGRRGALPRARATSRVCSRAARSRRRDCVDAVETSFREQGRRRRRRAAARDPHRRWRGAHAALARAEAVRVVHARRRRRWARRSTRRTSVPATSTCGSRCSRARPGACTASCAARRCRCGRPAPPRRWPRGISRATDARASRRSWAPDATRSRNCAASLPCATLREVRCCEPQRGTAPGVRARSARRPPRPCDRGRRASARDAVRDADIVTTITTSATPVVEGAWLAPGSHCNAMGQHAPATRELDTAAIRDAAVFVDAREQAFAEKGEILIPIAEGAIAREHVRGELGEVVAGRVAGRTSREQTHRVLLRRHGARIHDPVRDADRQGARRGDRTTSATMEATNDEDAGARCAR